ncbi:unnamed protein product [Sphagnum jensenii]|uniref:Sulfhydryl oxidase n=1 Tax=Sphagnum jensenii TaxID=128206 RepID=A0ABP1B1X9_9BRYO
MLTGERRGVSGRRGMTVLGKIPVVPKPINLPSQRLENRGLDPNVEIVPRGSVSWGSAGRSPPTSTGAWGTAAPGSSPPVTNSAWGSKQGSSATGSNSTGGAAGAWGGGGSLPRPASAGSGTRPSSAGSIRQGEQRPDTPTANSSSNPPWGPRPTSGPGVQVQTQVQSQASFSRPRSADTLRAGPSLSGFGDSSAAALAPAPAWTGHATGGRLADEPHQASRFKLTRVDFPTLGSEKNPDLRPHPNDRPHTPTGGYGSQERRMPDGWRRDGPPFGGHPTIPDGNWHRDGPPPPMPPYGGQGLPSDSWRREVPPSGSSLDDNWRRGAAPLIGQYGHNPRGPGGPSHFPHDGAGSMHQPRFGLGSGPYGPSHPGPSGFGRPGDMYPNGPLLRTGVPMRPNNMFPGPGPYDAYYGHPGYANMEEQQRMMSGMGGPGPAGHGGYPFHHGPPFENFYPRGGMSQGPRQMPPHNFRDRNEGVGEGYNEGLSRGKGLKSEGVHTKDGRGDNEVFGERILPSQETGESHPGGSRLITSTGGENFQQAPRPSSGGHHSSHRDWGQAVSSDEPMDFSKPVFEEEIQAGSPRKQQSPGIGNIEGNASVNEVSLFHSGRTEAGSSEGKLSGEGPKDALENVMGGHDQSQQRAGNCLREVSASSGASSASTATGEPVAGAALRAGQHHSSATTKPSILGNSPRSALAADEKSVREAVLEKQSSLTSPPAPGVDSNGQTYSRAKMREIAAQRARQLQKEEEERIRDQKAKAHAKLEELNRRTTVTQVGKRKLKENPKPSPGDLRKRTHGSLSQPPPLLPSPNARVAPLLPSPAVEPQINSGGAVTKEELGRATWTFLHTLAAQYPEKPTKQQQRDVKELMSILSRLYPCKQCADHFVDVLKSHPVKASSGYELAQWMCKVHNVVNRSLGKPQFPCQRVAARWGQLDCEEGACDLEGHLFSK